MGNGGTHNGGGRNGGLGTIYGKPVTVEDLQAARRDYYMFCWQRSGAFPDKSVKPSEIEFGAYQRLMLKAKARQLGIHVSDEAQVTGANDFLLSIGRDKQAVPMSVFLERVLQPEGLDATDFQRFIADDLAIQQLIQTLGLPGAMVPPQEAAQLYDREHQEVSAQAVFFSATNYLSQVSVTPDALQGFYSNNMAQYHLPDRVKLNYLQYDLTNYLATAEQKLGKTNIDAKVDAVFTQNGMQAVPEAKTPEEAKAKIREMVLRQGAGGMAAEAAKDFVVELFKMDPLSPDNLVTLAKTKGLTVHTTAPFTEADGPEEFAAPADLIKTAFKLNDESPFSKPIPGAESVYVIGLAAQLPSMVQPLTEIREQVVRDYEYREAVSKAQAAGNNFYLTATMQMTTGKTFAQAAIASRQIPVAMKPFSLSTKVIPEAHDQNEAAAIRQAGFTTQAGHISQFAPTPEGGFVMFVQSLLPVDEASKAVNLTDFLTQLRHGRQNESFNVWLQAEMNRELVNTPVYEEFTGVKSSPRSP